MATLYILAFPDFDEADGRFVDSFRTAHDLRKSKLVAPHFTLMFGTDVHGPDVTVDAARAAAACTPPFQFACKEARLGTDPSDSRGRVFLVPETGSAELALLHRRVHAGALAPLLTDGRPFVPHITIGETADIAGAAALCAPLNRSGLHVRGAVRHLSVCALAGDVLTSIARLPLGH